jgi:hypothetical protein
MNVGVSSLLPSQTTLDALGIDDGVTTELIAGMTRDGQEVSAELYVAEYMANAGLLDFSLQDDGAIKIANADFSSFESQEQADKVITDSRAATLVYAKLVSEVKAHMAESATNENLMQAATTSDSPTAFELRFQKNMQKYGLQNKYSGVMEILGMPNPVETGEAMARSTWAMIDGIARITGEKPGALLQKHFAGMQAINRKATASTYQGLINKLGKEPKSKPVPVVNPKTKNSHALHVNDDGTATIIPNETKAQIQARLRSKDVAPEAVEPEAPVTPDVQTSQEVDALDPSLAASASRVPKAKAEAPQEKAKSSDAPYVFSTPEGARLNEGLKSLQAQIASGDVTAINNATEQAVSMIDTLQELQMSHQGNKKVVADLQHLIDAYDVIAFEAIATMEAPTLLTEEELAASSADFAEKAMLDAKARRAGTMEGPVEHKTKVAGKFFLGYGEGEVIKYLFNSGIIDAADMGDEVRIALAGDDNGNVSAIRVYASLKKIHGNDVANAIFTSLGYTSIEVKGSKYKLPISEPLFQSSDNGLTWKSQNGDTLQGVVLDAKADQLETTQEDLEGPDLFSSDNPLLVQTKVLNEDGTPRRLYAGTKAIFHRPEDHYLGTGAGGDLWYRGHYASESPKVASDYAGDGVDKKVSNIKVDLNAYDAAVEAVIKDPDFNAEGTVTRKLGALQKMKEDVEKGAWGYANNTLGILQVNAVTPADYKFLKLAETVFVPKEEVSVYPANVRMYYYDIKNPLDVDSKLTSAHTPLLNAAFDNGVFVYEDATVGDVLRTIEKKIGKRDMPDFLEKLGYDGITHINRGGKGGVRQWIAFRDHQIHSTPHFFYSGTPLPYPHFSKEGTRVYGVTQFEAQRAMITFFKGANLDTIVHETGHVLRRMLPPEVMKAVTNYSFETNEFDGDPIAPWIATDRDSKVTKRRRRDAEERFTHALVTYLLDGKFGKGIPKEARASFVTISEGLRELKNAAENGIRSEGPMTAEIVQVLNNLGKGSLDVKTIYEYNKTRPEGTRAMKVTDLWRGRKANGADTVTMSLLRMWDPEPNKRRDPVKWAEDEAEARLALDEDPDFVGKLVARLNQQGGSITSMELSAMRISLENQQQEFIASFLKATPKEAAKLAEGLAMRSIAETKQAIDLGTAEAGRVLRSLQSSIALTENLVTLKTLSDKGLLDESDVKLFQAMLKNPSANAAQVLSAKSKAAEKGWGDLYYQMYFNSLLSNPSTWGLNIGTTAMWTAYQVPHEILTSAVDAGAYMAHKIPGLRAVLNKFYYQGQPAQRQLYMRDVFSSLTGFMTGGARGAGKGAYVLATGQHPTGAGWMESKYDPDLAGDDLETHQLFVGSRSETVNKAVRKVGGIMSIPTRVMRASDAVFNTMAYERKMTQIIGREIKNRKMSKPMAKKFADDVRNSGHPAYEMFHIEAAQAARYSTFNDTGGKLTRYLMLMRHNSHLVRLMLPFLRTIVNLQKRALEMTPGLGLAMDAMARNDPKANRIHGHSMADSIAKQIEGMAIAAVLMMAVDDEEITANAPEDAKERANFYAQGKIPWAVKIGDNWYSYRALDPFGPMFAMLASFKQEFRNPQRMAQAEFDERMLAFSNTIFDNVLSSVWLNNFGEYAETRTAADKAKTVGRRLESMLIPFSGLMRFADRLETYPNQFLKEKTGNLLVDNAPKLAALVEGLTGIPFEAGRNAVNVWGEDIVIRHDNAFNLFFPLAWSKDKMDKTEQYFGDLGYYPSYPPKTFKVGYTHYKLDDDLWLKSVVGFGDKAKPAITKIIASPSFQKAPPQIQTKILSNILAKYRAPYVAKAKAEQFKRGLVEAPVRVYERPPDES